MVEEEVHCGAGDVGEEVRMDEVRREVAEEGVHLGQAEEAGHGDDHGGDHDGVVHRDRGDVCDDHGDDDRHRDHHHDGGDARDLLPCRNYPPPTSWTSPNPLRIFGSNVTHRIGPRPGQPRHWPLREGVPSARVRWYAGEQLRLPQ